jgi:hypothetical protein
MTVEAAMAWLASNRYELKRLAERGHPQAHRAMVAYMAAREKWSRVHTLEFERLQRSFCDALNDFCVEALSESGRAELRDKYGYRQPLN